MASPHHVGIGIAATVIIISSVILLCTTNNIIRSDDKLNVVCTTSLIADALKNVGGEHISITCLMGPGVDPHIYRAREHDVHALAAADIIFYNGLHLEGKMSEILHNLNAYTKTVAVADAVSNDKLIQSPDFAQVHDPHIWFDVTIWIAVVRHISNALSTIDPAHAARYTKNAEQYCTELAHLNDYIRAKVAQLSPDRRILVTAHDAFGYLGKAYGLKVVGLQGISTESEASMYDIKTLVTYILTHKIPAIFVESSIPRRTIEAVHHAVEIHNWKITVEPELYSDALGTPGTQADTYIGMLTYNIDVIVQALNATLEGKY